MIQLRIFVVGQKMPYQKNLRKVATNKGKSSSKMKIVSLDTSLEAASSTANVVAADSAKASETKVSDEKQTDNNENMDDAIPDDMPLSLYLSKLNRKRKNIVKSPKGKEK
ncbi:hypothetical protein ZOSMA_123G00760 [Zostera marina]|uniref:Uncharacterized protein n=1 Tax=Zostera marina TaxID=29655 RepID=A0A0K9Q2K6_ZOSMR|nr:hypothetical protein ZOSMA_123G00760 [Zostera marina]